MLEFYATNKFLSILSQNPENPAPLDVLSVQKIEPVTYYGFDASLHTGNIIMHKDVMDDVKKFFELAIKMHFPIGSVVPISDPKYHWDDELSCGDNNSSGFNYRTIARTNKLSNHAMGRAFDVNPVQNIYIKYDANAKELFRFPESGVYDEDSPGTLTHDHPLVALMKGLGWEWGGDWTPESGRIDYQHFEKHG